MYLKPNIIIGVTAIVVLFIMLSLAQEMNRRWQIQREVARLESDARDLERSVIELEHLNTYFRTDDYQERLAREKLNFRAPGEEVVLIPEEGGESTPSGGLAPPEGGVKETSTLFEWWKIFFVDEAVL